MSLKYDLTEVEHHRAINELVHVLSIKSGESDPLFFRIIIAYFLGKLAGTMSTSIDTGALRGEIPVNVYAIAMAASGFGKGYSVSIIEELEKEFKDNLLKNTWPTIAERNLWSIAEENVIRSTSDDLSVEDELEKLKTLMDKIGPYLFTQDSGTVPALKRLRHKLIYCGIGALNTQIDEIGSNLIGNSEILTALLELYDQGRIKEKLILNTNDSIRIEERDGKTPANMLIFGTPTKVFDSGQIEEAFMSFLDTGYARRSLFGWGIANPNKKQLSGEERYALLTQENNNQTLTKWRSAFKNLADESNYRRKINLNQEVGIELLNYENWCVDRVAEFPEHEEIRKAEMKNRFFKALKLAGAYAFVDQTDEIQLNHLLSAIKLVEESGDCFEKMLTRERPYVKLARYISAPTTGVVTHADLDMALPYYKGNQKAKREEMINLATAWGYKNNIIIKKSFDEGIEFFDGETLKESNTDSLILSYSDHYAHNYFSPEERGETCSFENLHKLTSASQDGNPFHWANHRFLNNHRSDVNTKLGFNLIVVDVDGTAKLKVVQELLRDIQFMTHTTKRHQKDGTDRFRLVIPMKYELHLDQEEYKEFMNSVLSWLPFDSDEGANQRARKWESNPNGETFYNLEAPLLDVLQFIPKTSKNDEFKTQTQKLGNLDTLERWFAQRMGGEGSGRNNQMIKYALALKDGGYTLPDAMQAVRDFDKKLVKPLGAELESTIFKTLAKRYEEENI